MFIGLSELLQGVGDELPEAEPAFLVMTTVAAAALRRSWESGFDQAESVLSTDFAQTRMVAPATVTVKTAEGYAFYALYPELHAEAARGLSPSTRFIGVRSIGAGLACVAAEAARAPDPQTVRPGGHPFARTVSLPAVDRSAAYAIVDEGPGLSGSSFGAVADALEAEGVSPDRIVFLPSHMGELGPHASARHRMRWSRARRLHVSFESAIAPRLPAWVADLTGPATSVDDVSGGGWRELTHGPDQAGWPPSAAHQERRKFLVSADRGRFLLKFVGLGANGTAAFERARRLHAAGVTPEPTGWRHGFLVERWIESRALQPRDRPALLDALGRSMTARTSLPASPDAGADLGGLAEMMRANVAEALGEAQAARLPRPPDRTGARVYVDGRLHAWEWRVDAQGRVVKTDAVDHCAAHDLIGAQPIAWDLAGAVVEHDLTPDEAAVLGGRFGPFWIAAYCAFQLGLWKQAAEALGGWPEEAERCRRQAAVYAERLRTSF